MLKYVATVLLIYYYMIYVIIMFCIGNSLCVFRNLLTSNYGVICCCCARSVVNVVKKKNGLLPSLSMMSKLSNRSLFEIVLVRSLNLQYFVQPNDNMASLHIVPFVLNCSSFQLQYSVFVNDAV